MDDFVDFMSDVLHGFKIIGVVLGYLILVAGILWGILSAILVLSGKLAFAWWLIPCWLEILVMVAGAVGNANK